MCTMLDQRRTTYVEWVSNACGLSRILLMSMWDTNSDWLVCTKDMWFSWMVHHSSNGWRVWRTCDSHVILCRSPFSSPYSRPLPLAKGSSSPNPHNTHHQNPHPHNLYKPLYLTQLWICPCLKIYKTFASQKMKKKKSKSP